MILNNLEEIAKELFPKMIQTYKDNPGMLMRESFKIHTSEYNDKEADEIWGHMVDIMNAQINPSGEHGEHEVSDFEIEVNNLYEEFLSSKSIESLSESLKKLKQIFEYFEENWREENLWMPLNDLKSIKLELDHLEYGLSHWSDIKNFIASSSNKQVDIQKGLELDKQKLSTFFYMMDKIGLVEKENIKNRVYIKIKIK